jgi:hypothetical protein
MAEDPPRQHNADDLQHAATRSGAAGLLLEGQSRHPNDEGE